MSKKKKKILWYSDSPAIETGFAQVAKQILKDVSKQYDVEVIGVEHFYEDYDKEKYPYTIHQAPLHDHFQTELFTKALKEWDFDILFTFHNLGIIGQLTPYIVEAQKKKGFKWVNYSPIDNETIQPPEVPPLHFADITVVYTEFGKRVCLHYMPNIKDKLRVIYHGSEIKEFKPIVLKSKGELKVELFNLDPEVFLVTNVNRNQWRKNLGATIAGFKLFKQITKAKAKLYLHCKVEDAGGDITRQVINLGLDPEDVILSQIEDEAFGVSRGRMNEIYNASDVIVTTTLGEGWGLSTTEAMSAGIPFLGPNNSSLTEIVGENGERGYLSKMTDRWMIPYGHANIPYFIPSVESFAYELKKVWEQRGSLQQKAKLDRAREWCNKYTWECVNKQWMEVFDGL